MELLLGSAFRPIFLILTALFIENVCCRDKCYSCNGVPTQRDCQNIATCGDHEQCYVRRLTTDNGNDMFESGCLSINTCNTLSIASFGRRKRSIVTCIKCCNGTSSSGDLCNSDLCSFSTSPNPVKKPKRCYQCNDVMKPDDCRNVVNCDEDQECGTQQFISGTAWQYRYKLTCLPKFVCATLKTLNNTNLCHECCDKDLCNRGQCGLMSLTKPEFRWKPNDRTLVEGDNVTLRCEANPKSKATLSWSFKPDFGTGTIPSNALYGPHKETLQISVKQEHSGIWTCTATNTAGSVTADARIAVFPAPPTGKK